MSVLSDIYADLKDFIGFIAFIILVILVYLWIQYSFLVAVLLIVLGALVIFSLFRKNFIAAFIFAVAVWVVYSFQGEYVSEPEKNYLGLEYVRVVTKVGPDYTLYNPHFYFNDNRFLSDIGLGKWVAVESIYCGKTEVNFKQIKRITLYKSHRQFVELYNGGEIDPGCFFLTKQLKIKGNLGSKKGDWISISADKIEGLVFYCQY